MTSRQPTPAGAAGAPRWRCGWRAGKEMETPGSAALRGGFHITLRGSAARLSLAAHIRNGAAEVVLGCACVLGSQGAGTKVQRRPPALSPYVSRKDAEPHCLPHAATTQEHLGVLVCHGMLSAPPHTHLILNCQQLLRAQRLPHPSWNRAEQAWAPGTQAGPQLSGRCQVTWASPVTVP